MSTPSREDIIKLKIAKARRPISEAEKMLEYNFANAGINRLYYACFYAATALLFSNDIFTKTHSGVKQMLGLHFVNPGLLSTTQGQFYSDIFRIRQGSDYDDLEEPALSLVKELSVNAKQFIDKAQEILNL